MDKEFAEVFQEEIVVEGKIEELGKQIAGLAHKFKEGKDDVMTMADEMITNGSMPDPEMIKMLETEEADMVIHLIAKKMGVQWTKDNGYGEMRFKQNYPEAVFVKHKMYDPKTGKSVPADTQDDHEKYKKMGYTQKEEVESQVKKLADRFKSMVKKEEVKIDEMKSSSGYELYHKDFSSAMQHAYAFAKKKGNTIDPKEIDDKVAVGPKKPSKGKVNRYALKAGKKLAHIQVANLDDKRYELNMYFDKEYKGKFEEVEEGIDIQKADMKDVIKDFQSSDAPQFKGKSDKKRKEMAIAAKLSKEEVEIDEVIGKVLGRAAMIGGKVAAKGAVKGATAVAKGVKKVKKKVEIAVATKIAKKQGNKEDLEIEGAAEFMAAASAAKKEGKKKFKFGGKEYPVTIKVDIPLANEEIANSVGGGGIAGLDTGLTAKKKKDDTDKAKKLRKQYLKGAGLTEEVQRTTFAGKDVFIVDSETFHNCRLGKKQYGRYETYVGNGKVGQTIREYGLKYPRRPIILQNGDSGPMLYLKYGRS